MLKSKKTVSENKDDKKEAEAVLEPDEISVTVETDEQNEEQEPVSPQKELQEAQDKYLRLAADFDNYRKRTLREKMELIQNAGESLLKDILPVVDDFERGLEAASKAENMDAVITGMNLIYSKMKDFLTNHGVKEIDALNEPFDTDWHEAVTNIPAPTDDMKGKIIDVIQKGYTMNDKIIRYSKVVVGE
jgi:molecular chaperone GrpE